MSASTASDWVGELVQLHLDAAYNLGRWLLGNEQDAADAVHDAFLRARRGAQTYAGGNARAWWLAIVRNCCLAKLSSGRRETSMRSVQAQAAATDSSAMHHNEVEAHAEVLQQRAIVARHLSALPIEFREVLVLREMEDLSYREIAEVMQVPIGTVMSRLARARALLQQSLHAESHREQDHGL